MLILICPCMWMTMKCLLQLLLQWRRPYLSYQFYRPFQLAGLTEVDDEKDLARMTILNQTMKVLMILQLMTMIMEIASYEVDDGDRIFRHLEHVEMLISGVWDFGISLTCAVRQFSKSFPTLSFSNGGVDAF